MDKIEIKNEILSLGSDNLKVFGGEYEGGINLQQVPDEITEIIYYLLSNKDKYDNFIEIGTAAGGNTKLFDLFFNFDNITIVDDNKHHKHHMRAKTLENMKYNEFIGDSQSEDAIDYIKNLDIKYDIMIIDADHSYDGVKKDTYNFIEFLNDDGILIFHDTIACEGVKNWFLEVKNNNLFDLEFIMEAGVEDFPRCGLGIFKNKKI